MLLSGLCLALSVLVFSGVPATGLSKPLPSFELRRPTPRDNMITNLGFLIITMASKEAKTLFRRLH